MPPPKLSPQWIKVHKSMSDSMGELTKNVLDHDKHFVGMIKAGQKIKTANGPFEKVKENLRTDSKMVRKALEANKTNKNKAEVKSLQKLIDSMFKEGTEVWDTHKGKMDTKKTNFYIKKALKEWMDAEKKSKDKMVKKILSKSKTPTFLVALSKTLLKIDSARGEFGLHVQSFNVAHGLLQQALDKVAKELPKVTAALDKTRVTADKMDAIPM